MLLAQAFLLIVRNPTLSQFASYFAFGQSAFSMQGAKRTSLHNLASEALEKQARHATVQKQPPSLISYLLSYSCLG